MKVNMLITCVDNGFYAQCLKSSLPVWTKSASSITVVTDTKDNSTADVAGQFGCKIHRTDVFYADGRIFGKSAAMEEARSRTMDYQDWILFADADVIPPDDWMSQIVQAESDQSPLYGCKRLLDNGDVVSPKGEIAGFFQLFHSESPYARQRPLLNPDWIHAGNYDSEFCFNWPASERITLPMVVRHFGPDGRNWCGRGNESRMERIRMDRSNGKNWRTERIKP